MTDFNHFIGTGAVSDKHAFDTAALTAWLEKNLEGFAECVGAVGLVRNKQYAVVADG